MKLGISRDKIAKEVAEFVRDVSAKLEFKKIKDIRIIIKADDSV